jgi:hypothetical protein
MVDRCLNAASFSLECTAWLVLALVLHPGAPQRNNRHDQADPIKSDDAQGDRALSYEEPARRRAPGRFA